MILIESMRQEKNEEKDTSILEFMRGTIERLSEY